MFFKDTRAITNSKVFPGFPGIPGCWPPSYYCTIVSYRRVIYPFFYLILALFISFFLHSMINILRNMKKFLVELMNRLYTPFYNIIHRLDSFLDCLLRLVCLLMVHSCFMLVIELQIESTFSSHVLQQQFLYCFTYSTNKLLLLNIFSFLFLQTF